MYYATHTVHDHYNDGAQVFAFETRAARDRFVKHGPRGCWSLVYPYEQKAITAREARKVARRDGYGDAYAIDGDAGGVFFVCRNVFDVEKGNFGRVRSDDGRRHFVRRVAFKDAA